MKHCAALALALFLLLPFCSATGSDNPDITRAAFVELLWNAAGAPEPESISPFTDLPPNFPAAWGFERNIVRGTGDRAFSPERAVTREESAAFLRRFAASTGRDTFLPNGLAACNDYEDISPWADDSLYWATDRGILGWAPGGRLDPYGTLTPDEAIAAISRLIESN